MGVFPTTTPCRIANSTLPHARGGVSVPGVFSSNGGGSSPRPWGCFSKFRSLNTPKRLFPTPVGVFPQWSKKKKTMNSLPHARGGVSSIDRRVTGFEHSSPRPWGCFGKGRERTALNSDRTEEESAAMAASSRRASAFSNQCSFHTLIFAKKRVIYTETKNFN